MGARLRGKRNELNLEGDDGGDVEERGVVEER